jgi:Cytidylate kinase-like family
MNSQVGFEKCLTFIDSQLRQPGQPVLHHETNLHPPVVTISRQSGSGGHLVAEKLLSFLQGRSPKESPPWTIFDRNLVEKVLEDHHLPKSLARFLGEEHISEINDTLDELFGLHPPSWTLVRNCADTILHLAELGNVIFIGRAANIITARLNYAFHVRLVGSPERRARHMAELEGLAPKAARQFIRHADRGRERYVRKYFKQHIEDPLLYHLVINTDAVPYEEAARLIGEAVAKMMPQSVGEKPRLDLSAWP